MSLFDSILNYSNEIRDLKDKCNDDSKKLQDKFSLYAKSINQKIKDLQEKKELIEKESSDIKNLIEQNIKNFYVKKAYDYFSSFVPNLSINVNTTSTVNNDLEQFEKNYYESLVKHKEILSGISELELQLNNNRVKIDNEIKELQKQCNSTIKSRMLCLKKSYQENLEKCCINYYSDSIPFKSQSLPDNLTIGNFLIHSNNDLKEIHQNPFFKVPLILNLIDKGNLIINVSYSNALNETYFDNIISALMMRFLESFPNGTLHVGVHSSSISSFGKLSSLYAGCVKGKISINNETSKTNVQFSKLLLDISEKGEAINNLLLENSCINIFDLYKKNIKTERFNLIFLHNIFKDMSLDQINQLYGCISEYSKCGLKFIIIDDFNPDNYKNKSQSFNVKLQQILDTCLTLNYCDNKLYYDKCLVELISAENLSNQDIYKFISLYSEYKYNNKTNFLSYEEIGFGKENSSGSKFDSIEIPVAICEPNIWEIKFDCVGHSPNANLIVGIPGTGKSTLIDSLIMNGAMKYSPDELNFQLLDFKDGISSSVYTMENCKIPHVKVVSQNNKPEDAEIILSNILIESERRNKEFIMLRNSTGQAIRNIVEYNNAIIKNNINKKIMPRLIIVIDECQYLFDDDNLSKQCQDIVRKCRSQGIHLILATQTLSHKMWGTVKFIEGIYCFEIAKDDAEQLLSRKYAANISKEVPKGSFMAFASNNQGNDCSKIRIAFDGGDTAKYASRIKDKWKKYAVNLVTIGDKSPKFIKIHDYNNVIKIADSYELSIGENYSDHSDVFISYSNSRPMILVGDNQNGADSIFKSIVYTASKRNINCYLIDASKKQNVENFIINNNLKSNSMHIGDETAYMNYLKKIYDIYKIRQENIRVENEPIIFIINNLHSIIDFINNKTMKPQTKSEQIDYQNMNISDIVAQMQNQSNLLNEASINGRDTLIPFLFNNAYKANIFICIYLESLILTNDAGDQVLGFSHRNIMKTCKYKILFNNCSSDVRSIMEDSFKEKTLNGMNENMVYLSCNQKDFYKLRFYQFEGDDK